MPIRMGPVTPDVRAAHGGGYPWSLNGYCLEGPLLGQEERPEGVDFDV